jgi:hypothetical protein
MSWLIDLGRGPEPKIHVKIDDITSVAGWAGTAGERLWRNVLF